MSRAILSAVALLFVASPALVADEKLEVGDPAPKFSAKDDTGETWKSSDVDTSKKTLVVYFYPADLTPGCTKQAQGFRDDMEKLKAKGVVVVGVSGDSVANHQKFRKEHDLNFPLLSDTKGEIAKAFGVKTRRIPGGKIKRITGETLPQDVVCARWTFIIQDGKVVYKNTKVNAAKDSAAILSFLEKSK